MIDDYDNSEYSRKGWSVYALCSCGWYRYAPFGDPFHICLEVCPECGEDKDEWKVVVAKVVATKIEKKKRWHFQRYKYSLEIKVERKRF